MNQFKKRHFPRAMAAIILVISIVAGGIVIFAQSQTEQKVKDYDGTEFQPSLYKNSASSKETAAAVCEKFGLDYETVTLEEINSSREIRDYQSAAALKLEYKDKDIMINKVNKENGEFVSSLESHVNDVFAFSGGGDIIEKVCRDAGINAIASKIGDLSIEQLIEIERLALETSPHGK